MIWLLLLYSRMVPGGVILFGGRGFPKSAISKRRGVEIFHAVKLESHVALHVGQRVVVNV